MSNAKQQRILVTGGAGYIGTIVVGMLLERGYAVEVVDSLIHEQQSPEKLFPGARLSFHRGDVRDEAFMRPVIGRADTVIHLAALVGEPVCRQDPKACYAVNRDGAQLINRLRRKDQPLIFSSTTSVYGINTSGACHEDVEMNPLGDYARSKLEAEQDIKDKGNYVIFRFATAFGPSYRHRLDLLPNELTYRAVHEGALSLYDADKRRTIAHVEDLAAAVVFAAENFQKVKANVFNIGDEAMNLSKRDIASAIQACVPCQVSVDEERRDPDQRDFEVSYAKMRQHGFVIKHALSESIGELAGIYRGLRRERSHVNFS